jgi:acetylornithine deacetylase
MPPISQPESVDALLCELIAIPSVNPMGREVSGPIYLEGKLSDWLVDFFESIGAPCQRFEVAPGRANVIARYDAAAANTILLDAHQDTVPVEGMTIAPFTPVCRDGKIFGRGATDVKGSLAAMLFAFRRICRERPAIANLILSCTCDEESTTLGIRHLVNSWNDLNETSLFCLKPTVAIIAEPTELNVVTAHRGVVRFRVITKGRACHSSSPAQGINAIYRMARIVAALQEYAENLNRLVAAHPLCGEATLSVGRIEGGTSVNIVPDHCSLEVDRRILPGESCESVIASVREFLQRKIDFEFTIEPPFVFAAPLSDHNNQDLSARLLREIDQVSGQRQSIGVAFCTHASFTGGQDVPSIVFGPGSIEQAHTRDEFIEIKQLHQAADIYYRICCAYADKE